MESSPYHVFTSHHFLTDVITMIRSIADVCRGQASNAVLFTPHSDLIMKQRRPAQRPLDAHEKKPRTMRDVSALKVPYNLNAEAKLGGVSLNQAMESGGVVGIAGAQLQPSRKFLPKSQTAPNWTGLSAPLSAEDAGPRSNPPGPFSSGSQLSAGM